jgi:hypothetical protein
VEPFGHSLQAAPNLATFVVVLVRHHSTTEIFLAVDAETTITDEAAAFLGWKK